MRSPSSLERLAIRTAAALASRSADSASLLVLIYHRVPDAPDPLMPDEPCAERFDAEIGLLSSCFNLLPLREAVGRLRDGNLQSRSACITFDDGYANNCEIAAPILCRHAAPATIFVAPGFLDGGRMFNDTVTEFVRRAPDPLDLRSEDLGIIPLSDAAARRAAIQRILSAIKHLPPDERLSRVARIVGNAATDLPRDLMMSSEQVRKVHGMGIEVGAHTVDHPILSSLDDEAAQRQISDSKARLESILGSPVTTFAYPNGNPARDYGRRHATMAQQAGFELAVSTAYGAATAGSDPYQIPRVSPTGDTPLQLGLRLARVFSAREPATAP